MIITETTKEKIFLKKKIELNFVKLQFYFSQIDSFGKMVLSHNQLSGSLVEPLPHNQFNSIDDGFCAECADGL